MTSAITRATTKTRSSALLALALVVSACAADHATADPIDARARERLAALSPETLPPNPPDLSNRFADDPAAARLGQRLFFDPSFAGPLLDKDNDGKSSSLGKAGQTGRVACASCHLPDAGFVDTRSLGKQISLAAGWGLRKAPSLLDVGQAKLVTWDGRRDALYNQVFGPIESPVEMNSSRLYVAQQMARAYRADYEAVFGPMPPLDDATRFPRLDATVNGCKPKHGSPEQTCDGSFRGRPGDQAEFDALAPADQDAVTRVVVNSGKAIAAYERKLTCGTSRFDRFMHGDMSALDSSEQRGAALFVGKGDCVRCHSGPYLSDQKFHHVGLAPKPVGVVFADINDHGASSGLVAALADPLNVRGAFSDGDDGRLPASVTPDFDGAFKTPMLRCVDRRPSFMHTAQIRSLAQVVDFFDRGGDGPGLFGKNELHPLGLTDGEKADLVKFLLALAGPGPDKVLLQP